MHAWFQNSDPHFLRTSVLFLLIAGWQGSGLGAPGPWFRIEVVDDSSGRGVPNVELRTVNGIRHRTDSNGLIAFHEPGLMGEEVYFHVESDGYRLEPDGLGNTGVKLHPVPGESARIPIRRTDIAERLYRVTGQGIFRDSILLDVQAPIRDPLLNARVAGQDTVVATVYRDQIFWFWGDTERFSYPLGNFLASGATSELPGRGGLPPDRGVDLRYFKDDQGFVAPMCPGFGPGLQWIESVFVLRDGTGGERLAARISSQNGLEPAYAWHLAVWNDDQHRFESRVRWDVTETHDAAHPFRARVDGVEYLFLYPNHRVPAEWTAVTNRGRYESFTCLRDDGQADRDSSGLLRWRWRAGAVRPDTGRLRQWIADGRLRREESWMRPLDATTGNPIELHRGSVSWNAFRQCWILIASGAPGDVWYCEARSPTGPWEQARRIVTHKAYNFYNPVHHPFFDEAGGRRIYFEGTYTAAFSAAREKTPRYDYNQVMYRLDLSDPRLNLPTPRTPPLDPIPVVPLP